MNKVVVISRDEENRVNVNTGGIELDTVHGLREAIGLATLTVNHLSEMLIEARAQELLRKITEDTRTEGRNAVE